MRIALKLFAAFLLAFLPQTAFLQTNAIPAKPKLIVGIVVDQMRYDFLYRYYDQYGTQGFKRLLNEGFSCENTHYNYIPTYTAPGHTAIYSGATPAMSGIVGNEWWDPEWNAYRYVTTDTTVKTVGAPGKKVGRHSPRVLLSTTITDELRLSNNFASKVAGVCLKDRASILPAGHIPNAAYWFDDETGNWITSTYYPDSLGLPQWAQAFNAKRLPEQYLSKPWELDPTCKYTSSFAGWEKFNDGQYGKFPGELPYNLPEMRKQQGNGFGLLRFTPAGSALTVDFAIATLAGMQMGKGEVPDFLCLSFSSPDYCAHQFGIHGRETEDVYLQLDRQIARLLNYLDQQYGKNNVLVFLTADHGGGETPAHLNSIQVPAGVFDESLLEDRLEKAIAAELGVNANFISWVGNQQVYLNWQAIGDLDADPDAIAGIIGDYLRAQPGVYEVYTRGELTSLPTDYPLAAITRAGIHPRRSGDIIFQLDPAWHPDDKAFGKGGTTHGSPYPYDTHVPLLWYGWKIAPGASFAPVDIIDIAPTLAAMLRITEPNANQGKVITELLKGR